MLLKDWLEAQKMSPADFADLIGVHRSTVGHWINDGTRPGPRAMKRVFSTTIGAVTANDFMDGGPVPDIPCDEERAASKTNEVAA